MASQLTSLLSTSTEQELLLERIAERLAGVNRLRAQLLFDAQDLVVLRKTLAAAWRSSLDLGEE